MAEGQHPLEEITIAIDSDLVELLNVIESKDDELFLLQPCMLKVLLRPKDV